VVLDHGPRDGGDGGGVDRGKVKVGGGSWSWWASGRQKTVVTGVEMFRKLLTRAGGDKSAAAQRGGEDGDRGAGWCWPSPGASSAHQVPGRSVTSDQGRGGAGTRRSSRATTGQFYFRTTDVTGNVELPAGVEMVMPATTCRWTSS